MILDDRLAAHLLVELCSRWNTELEDLNKKEGKCKQIHEDIAEDKKIQVSMLKMCLCYWYRMHQE